MVQFSYVSFCWSYRVWLKQSPGKNVFLNKHFNILLTICPGSCLFLLLSASIVQMLKFFYQISFSKNSKNIDTKYEFFLNHQLRIWTIWLQCFQPVTCMFSVVVVVVVTICSCSPACRMDYFCFCFCYSTCPFEKLSTEADHTTLTKAWLEQGLLTLTTLTLCSIQLGGCITV